MTETYDVSAQLVAEKFKHAIDLLRSETKSLRQTHQADKEMILHRLNQLEEQSKDHETRIRDATAGVTQFKAMITLTSFIAVILSIISALIVIFSGL